MNKRVVFYLNKITLVLFAAIMSLGFNFTSFAFAFSYSYNLASAIAVSSDYLSDENKVLSKDFPNLKDIITEFFGKNKKTPKDERVIMVYPGGFPLGFTMDCKGVVVVAVGDVLTEEGLINPLKDKNIKVGDIVYSINGETVLSASHMQTLVNLDNNLEVSLDIYRGSEIIKETVTKQMELSTKMYRLGLWVRDNAAGVGTLTYVREDSLRFGALGHPVCDIDTGKVMPVSGGSIFKCNIVGYNKGMRGNPGELRGLFLKSGVQVGSLDSNNNFGVYGVINEDYVKKMNVEPIQVGFRDSVKTGKATILSTIEGGEPIEYEIEIIKLNYQSSSDKKSMVIRVTDERLINSTGGIVQGMSGSPIIQNGKLIGAVTHVFVSDPTKGFGVYIDWMIDN